MQNNIATITVNEEIAKKIESFYASNKRENTNQFVRFFAKDDVLNMAVTLYFPKKGKSTMSCVFQGENAENEASIFGEAISKTSKDFTSKKVNKNVSTKSFLVCSQIGSDEVGTGDFFGPISVTAAYVDKSQFEELKKLGVTDSKKLTDEFILSIGPTLIKKFKYSQLLLDNPKYNEVNTFNNMNEIKAKMHNRCILNLLKQFPNAKVFQDQFAAPKTYFNYLKNEEEVATNITFSTKGELKFPSVALASCIARYSFLKNMEKLNNKYKENIPFGASASVKKFAVKFAKKHGINELKSITKQNFKTFKEVLDELKE